jgi:hypothetical protein
MVLPIKLRPVASPRILKDWVEYHLTDACLTDTLMVAVFTGVGVPS